MTTRSETIVGLLILAMFCVLLYIALYGGMDKLWP